MTPERYSWERLASTAAQMPKDLPAEEQAAYQAMRWLYMQYKAGRIPQSLAAKESAQIRAECRRMAEARAFGERQMEHMIAIWRDAENGASEYRQAIDDAGRLKAAEKMLRAIEGRTT